MTVRPHTGVSVFPQHLYNLLVDVFRFYTGLRLILAKQHFSPPFNCDISLQWQELVLGLYSLYKSVTLSM